MRSAPVVLVLTLLAVALGACGESDEEKAMNTAIKKDLNEMSDAQSDLSDDRRSEVEAATKEFTGSVKTIASDLGSSLSVSDAKAQLVTALQQLEASYKKTFAPLDCS
jgi:hypothetical protein